MDIAHRLRVTTGASGMIFECTDGCARRLAVDRISGKLTVLDKGDQMVQHYGSSGGVDLHPTDILNA